jgi:photosystem II stability/assembly factor-like uncharacterized protein
MKRVILVLIIIYSNCLADEPAWELVSMNPPRASVRDGIIADNHDIYISSDGIFKSTDYGETWKSIIRDREALCFTKNDEGTIYCIIAQRTDFQFSISDIYKLRAKDSSWNKIEPGWGDTLHLSRIVKNGEKLLAVLFHDNWDIYLFEMDFKSEKWKELKSPEPDSNIYFLTSRFYAKDSIMINLAEDLDHTNVLYLTTNSGKNWKQIKLLKNDIHSVLILETNEYLISTEQGIFKTWDFGETWFPFALLEKQIWELKLINDKIIYAYSTRSCFLSYDDGITWNKIDFPNNNNSKYQYYYAFMIDREDKYFIGTDNYGIFRSTDSGLTWEEKNSGISAMQPQDIIIYDSTIVMSSNGIFKSDDLGRTFDYLGFKVINTQRLAVNSLRDLFFNSGKIYCSTDSGKSWETFGYGSSDNPILINKRDVLLTPYYYVNTNSREFQINTIETDVGYAISTNDAGDLFRNNFNPIFEEQYPNEYGIHRSTDDGLTWEKVGGYRLGYPDVTSNAIRESPVFNSKTKTSWFQVMPINRFEDYFWGVYLTTNNGKSWDTVNLWRNHNVIRPYPSDAQVDSTYNWIYSKSGEGYGVYRSYDNGKTWKRMDTSGLPLNMGGKLAVSPEGYIYVATKAGLYRSTKNYVSVNEENRNFNTKSNFSLSPNPASEYIEISGSSVILSEAKNLGVSIYDVLGVEVYCSIATPPAPSQEK